MERQSIVGCHMNLRILLQKNSEDASISPISCKWQEHRAVLLTRDTCDPLNRRAVRVSMGSVFLVPWTWLDGPISSLHEYGFQTAAMALCDDSISLDDARLKEEPRLAVIMGTEGDGLPQKTISEADYTVKIPMAHGVDSLNVAAAAAVTFWELRR